MRHEWDVRLFFDEDGRSTECEARLVGERAPGVVAHGAARCSDADRPETRIGKELAAARALNALARRMLAQASGDIEDALRHPVQLLH
ncbi:dsRBD fold-containing protein [Streptomyces sp. NPDC001380]|uniref:dsRBD fold-containing protein n=1 Tax=Streptomyces sp. NPDC001380 TaxID=3364566 RepID=UPI00369A8028